MTTEMSTTTKKIDPQSIEFITPVQLRPGVYSNALSVNISNADITLNFLYINPSDEPVGTLVSRIIISHDGANNVIDVLNRAKAQFAQVKNEEEKKS